MRVFIDEAIHVPYLPVAYAVCGNLWYGSDANCQIGDWCKGLKKAIGHISDDARRNPASRENGTLFGKRSQNGQCLRRRANEIEIVGI
ncbi:hypothetical protein D9M72_639230 [compost metagenome]